MKTECQIEKIKQAVLITERVSGKNLTLPILSSVLITASGKSIKIRSTNLSIGVDIEIPAKINEEGEIAVKADVLANVFGNIYSDGNIEMESKNGNLSIKTKNNFILLKGQLNEEFPTIPTVSGQKFTISSSKLSEGIKSVYYSCAISDIKPEISCVYIYQDGEFLIFIATDSFRLAEKKIKIKGVEDFPGILIPFKNISEILRVFGEMDGDISVCVSKNQISFYAKGVYLTSRVIDGIFPDYKQIMPKSSITDVVILKQDLLNALKISNIFSDKFNQVSIDINPKEKKIILGAKNADVGENIMNLSAALTGEPVIVNLNYRYFLDCFQSIGQDSVVLRFNQASKPIVIQGVSDSSFTYLIMPMNR